MTIEEIDDDKRSLTFMTVEVASGGFPLLKIVTMRTEARGQTGKRHTERRYAEHADAARGDGKAFKIPHL